MRSITQMAKIFFILDVLEKKRTFIELIDYLCILVVERFRDGQDTKYVCCLRLTEKYTKTTLSANTHVHYIHSTKKVKEISENHAT